MRLFALTIISYRKLIFRGQARYCGVTTLSGSLGLEAFHEPIIGVLRDGSEITYTEESGATTTVAVESGIVTFTENSCSITVSLVE